MSLDDDFSSGRFESPVERRRARSLLDILDRSPQDETYPHDVFFLHATSVETMEQFVKTGNIPGRSYATFRHKKGEIFMYPLTDRMPARESLVRQIPPTEVASREDIVGYANLLAERHYMMTRLAIPFSDARALRIVDELLVGVTPRTTTDLDLREKIETFLRDHGGEMAVGMLLAEAKLRKGVILGIKKSALRKYPLERGDPGDGDIKMKTGRGQKDLTRLRKRAVDVTKTGLDLTDIGMIQVLGPEGAVYFDDLRRRL